MILEVPFEGVVVTLAGHYVAKLIVSLGMVLGGMATSCKVAEYHLGG